MVESDGLLHVHDLPQIYQKPAAPELVQTLEQLKLEPFSFQNNTSKLRIDPDGIPRYLTSIVSSSLSWLDDSAREQIWTLASARLSERSGRTAMPSMSREFQVTPELTVTLFEPSLTEDNLGLKTWTSSLLLARRLSFFKPYVSETETCRVLELGAGTGLVGIAAACLWRVDVTLTDLKKIVPNLTKNVGSNSHLLERHGTKATVDVLDWADTTCRPGSDHERYQVILAADPIYSKNHPKLLVDAMDRWLDRSSSSCFIVELPIRKAYREERDDLRRRLSAAYMELVDEGTEIGYDDWQTHDGQPVEVVCWWSVWKTRSI